LPYTLQWNGAVEQGLGSRQSLSMSYVGSVGRRLMQPTNVFSPNVSITRADLEANTATSDYHALQVQFVRRLSKGLQALTSYTWAHSIDTASAGSIANTSNLPAGTNQNANRASSDFDIRNALSAGVTYVLPVPKSRPFVDLISRGWSLQGIFQTRSAVPMEVFDGNFDRASNGFATDIRPDAIHNIPQYLRGTQYPGGKAINPVAFKDPPIDSNGNPVRQGNVARNGLRGFGLAQLDFAVHRDFPIHEAWTLQFRAEAFNVLNHPNFAPPVGDLSRPDFGLSTQMLGQYLGGGSQGTGSFNSLYQVGGARSMQFALKLSF